MRPRDLENQGTGNKKDTDTTENVESDIGEELMFKPLIRQLPKLNGRRLQRASCSFRFYGDFFDRYWTCHYLDSYMGETAKWEMNEYLNKDSQDLKRLFNDGGAHVWQQRKILEQLLFHLIISEVNVSTRNIRKIHAKLDGETNGTEEVTTSDSMQRAYFRSQKTWAELHEILEFLNEDRERVCSNVKNWNSR